MPLSTKPPKKYGRRHLLTFLLFCCNFIHYTQKANLSVGIVAMMDNTDNPMFQKFEWDEFTRGIILSSLFWGYTIAPMPAGFIGQQYGAKWPLFITMFVGSIATMLTPVVTFLDWKYLCAARFICGLMQGSTYPLFQVAVSKWLHPDERGTYTSIVFSGSKFGIGITLIVSGVIASSKIGWPGIFYISGGIGFIWCAIWWRFISETPAECNGISSEEQNYLSNANDRSVINLPAPWKQIFTSIPYWSTLISQICGSWGFYLLLSEIPTYINGVFNCNINSNGLLSSIPYFLMFCISLVFSYFSNLLTTNRYVSKGVARKIFNTIGEFGPGLFILILSFTWNNTILSMILLNLTVGLMCGANNGFLVNYLDLSPNFAGYLMGISTFPSNITSLLGPIIVGYIVTDITDPFLWQYIFWITSVIYFIGSAVFLIFSSGEIQPWDEPIVSVNTTDSLSAKYEASEKFVKQ